MKRHQIAVRNDWQARVEDQGLLFHTDDEAEQPAVSYWAEGTYYSLSSDEVATIERATNELHEMCLAAAQHVIDTKRYAELGVPDLAVPLIEDSWDDEPPSIYGRMDLALGPGGVPKLLEYNADTPTSLLEGAVIQWTWLTDLFPHHDQFNSIHDRLIATWGEMHEYLDSVIAHFGWVEDLEDEMTVGYLRDTAEQAGLSTIGIAIEEIGWRETDARFVDLAERPIRTMFKLYPWEGMFSDEFAPLLARDRGLQWIEPAWKMLLSTKGILPILWELFPGHPNLLPAARSPETFANAWVKKPLHGREGSNVTIVAPGVSVATQGPYVSEAFVYQAYADLGEHDGMRPVIGSWLVGGESAGIGIRETDGYVTSNTARFVPHLIR